MRTSRKRIVRAAGILAGGGILLATANTGCLSFAATSLVQATDFCFIFDCQNGLFGGTIDPCSGQGSDEDTIEADQALPVFTDCAVEGP